MPAAQKDKDADKAVRKTYIPKAYARKRFYTKADVEEHSTGTADCWVSLFGKVYDLAPLLVKHQKGKKRRFVCFQKSGRSNVIDEGNALISPVFPLRSPRCPPPRRRRNRHHPLVRQRLT